MNFLKPRRRSVRVRAAAADAAFVTEKASLKPHDRTLTKAASSHEKRTLQDEEDEMVAEAWNSQE